MSLSKVRISSQTKEILDHICNPDIVKTLGKTNLSIESEIFEIVKIQLREVARHWQGYPSESEMLSAAITKVERLFEKKLKDTFEDRAEYMLEAFRKNYFANIKNSFQRKDKDLQKSLEALSDTTSALLKTAGTTPRLSPSQILKSEDDEYEKIFGDLKTYSSDLFEKAYLDSQSRISLELSRVGFDEFIEGLVIYPILIDAFDFFLNLENLPGGFSLTKNEDGKFPFEILQDRSVFILDQDGSIFVFVENFSPKSLGETGYQLIHLAKHLYYT